MMTSVSSKVRDGLLASLLLIAPACGSSAGTSGPGEETNGAPVANPSGNAPPDGFGPSDGGVASGCSDAAKDIFVVSNSFELYRFDPPKLSFSSVGRLDCLDGTKFEDFDTSKYGISFEGIAVSSNGRGWLNVRRNHGSLAEIAGKALVKPNDRFADAALVQFDTANGSCTAGAFQQIASNAEAAECLVIGGAAKSSCRSFDKRYLRALTILGSGGQVDELYGSNGTLSSTLFSVEPATGARTEKGVILDEDDTYLLSLAGTSDRRMFASWLNTKSVAFSVSTVDPNTAVTTPFEVVDFASVEFWPSAMTFWGGELWFFGGPRTGGSVDTKKVRVVRYDLKTKTPTVMIDDVGDAIKKSETSKLSLILGAANSPCAPLSAPK